MGSVGVVSRLRAAIRAGRKAWSGVGRRDSYKGAEVNRLVEDWITSIMHPDDEMRWSIRRLRARSRELSRNNPFARAFLTALSVNVIGPSGPKHQAQVRNNNGDLNKILNDKIEAGWSEWSEAPTVDGKMNLTRFQHQTIKTIARDGEAFVRMHYGFGDNPWGFALESIDADQLDELFNVAGDDRRPEVRLGVEVNIYGRPLGYHFWNKPERTLSMVPREKIRIPANEIIHLYDPDRVNQTRGVPWAATVMWPLKMLEGYMESEAVAARAGAAKMGFWTRKPDETTVGEIAADPETNTITMDAAPGTFEFGPDGYELQTWDSGHPNSAYESFVKGKLREIASGLGMSYNALANDLEGVNYSSMRSGLLIERDVWRAIQQWWIEAFLRRVYQEWMSTAILNRTLVLDSRDFRKFLAADWAPRGWPWVDPLKDTTAGIAGIQAGLTSRRRLLAEQGLDVETIFEELKAEKELAEQFDLDVSGPKVPTTQDDKDDEDEDDEETDSANGNGRRRNRLMKAGVR